MTPGRGDEGVGVLGVDAALEGVAGQDDVLLGEGEGLARGHVDLLLDEVAAAHELGDPVLHLDPGVHLHEVVVAVGVEQELDGARVHVLDGGRGLDRRPPHAAAQLLREDGRGRLLDELLVAALDRALALAQVHDVALAVRHDLDLDVAGAHARTSRCRRRPRRRRPRLRPGRPERRGRARSALRTMRMPRPPPPADAFRITGKPMSRATRTALSSSSTTPGEPGTTGHARLLHGLLGPALVPHQADGLGPGPDELDVAGLADLGQVARLGEEPVAGVDGVGARDLGRADDGGDVEVRLDAARGADADGLVREPDVEAAPGRPRSRRPRW